MVLAKTSDGLEYFKVNEKYIPKDWTNEPEEFDEFPYCDCPENYKFPSEKAIPIIADVRSMRYLFKAGNKFYSWWAMAGLLERIEAPTDIKNILELLQSGKACKGKILSSSSAKFPVEE